MANKIFLTPKEGMRVVDPVTRAPLPAAGAAVERNTYWIRRINDGDVVEGEAPTATATKKSIKGA